MHLSGSQLKSIRSNYTEPYPGGVYGHTMVIDSTDSALYVFGGWGFDNSSIGIYYRK